MTMPPCRIEHLALYPTTLPKQMRTRTVATFLVRLSYQKVILIRINLVLLKICSVQARVMNGAMFKT